MYQQRNNNTAHRLTFLHTEYQYAPMALHEITQGRAVIYLKMPPAITDVNQLLDYIIQFDEDALIHADILVLDEADKCPEKILAQSLKKLMTMYPCDVLVMTRCLPYQSIWEDAFHHSPQVITSAKTYPVLRAKGQYILHATALGQGVVSINGKTVHLPVGEILHSFVFFLLENLIVSREKIFKYFWSDSTYESATASFTVARQTLRQRMGVELLLPNRTNYHLNPQLTIIYDVDMYRQCLESALYAEDAQDQCRNAYALYQYDYLMTTTASWAKPIRDDLRRKQADVCYYLAQQQSDALGLLSQGIRHNPYREDMVLDMMKHYLQQKMPHDALQAYTMLADYLKTQHDIAPHAKLTNLAQQAEALYNP